MLAYLALHEPQHRDVVGALLWPDQDAAHARGALRRTLSAVKKSVPEDAIVATRDLVGMKPGSIWVDVTAFRAAVAAADADAGALESAVAVYHDDFLNGFALRGAPEFDDWVAIERENLRRDATRCLARLGMRAIEAGSLDHALTYLLRWVALDPLDETAHRTLIETYLASGDRAAALRQYEECVRVLDEELAVAPLDETTALYESIRSGSGLRPGGHSTPEREDTPDIPFVGRAMEMQRCVAAIGDQATRLLAVEGEAGIGKSALLDLIAARSPLPCLEVRCHEEERDQALGAVARLLRTLVEETSTRTIAALPEDAALEAARLVPDIRSLHADLPEAAPLSDPGARTTFFEGVWDTVMALRDEGALLVFDDIHWLDDGSFELLAFGLRREDLGGIKLAMSWRTEEIDPAHRLRRFIADLERSTGVAHLTLPRLERDDVRHLVAAVAPDSAPTLADTLFEESEGVPFFVVEYLRSHTSTAAPMGGVEGFVRAQVTRLSPVAQQVLTAASVLGRSSDLDLLRAVAGRNDDEMVEAIEELTGRRMLLERTEGYDFAHEKVRQVIYGDASLARLRLLHRRAHEHLLKVLTQRPETRALAAYHALRAGRDAEAAEHYRIAGEHARGLGANVDALSHFQNALALGDPNVAHLHEAIGDVQTLLGRYGDALSSYRSALARSNESWRLEHKLGRLYVRRGEAVSALGHLETALGNAPSDMRADRARISADIALALRFEGREGDAREAAERALLEATDVEDPVAIAQAHNILGLLEPEDERALGHLRDSEAAARAVADTGTRVAALNNIALVHRRRKQSKEAIEAAEQALELCVRRGDIHREAALHNNLADVLHEIGDETKSREHARAAAALFARVGEPGVMSPEIWKLVEW